MNRLVEFARDELGITLTPSQAEMLGSFDEGDFEQAVWQCGRRAGKSLLSDIIVLADVALRDHLRAAMRPGEQRVSAIVAPRLEQAQQHIIRCLQLIEHSKHLKAMVVGEPTSTEIVFSNGSVTPVPQLGSTATATTTRMRPSAAEHVGRRTLPTHPHRADPDGSRTWHEVHRLLLQQLR